MDNTLIKKIEIERKFATAVYKNFVSLRFGMNPCCIIDEEAATINKELCDWQEKATCEQTCNDTAVESKGFLKSTPYQEAPSTSSAKTASCAPVTYCPDTSVLDNILKSIQELSSRIDDQKVDDYVFTQSEDSITWEIEHNLDKYPNVRLELLDGTDIQGEITNIDKNNMRVTFDVAVSGRAYLT